MMKNKLVDKIELRPLKKLIGYENNARIHSEEQIDQIVRSIEKFGFVNPVLIGSDNVIAAGHGRVAAAKKLKLSKVPVIVLDHLSEQDRKALVIADNQIALNASWDMDLLREEVDSLKIEDFDISLLGINEAILDDNDDLFDVPETSSSDSSDQKPTKSDEGYSSFELVMEHDNKLFLLDVINQIKNEHSTESIEDALMIMARHYVS